MRFYLHAFCLDEGKAKEGHEELIVGPFDWFQITWDWVRAGNNDDSEEHDHQFVLDGDGYWYPLAYVTEDATKGGSMQPDYERGRYTDIVVVPDNQPSAIIETGETYAPATIRVTNDQAALNAARLSEQEWMSGYEG